MHIPAVNQTGPHQAMFTVIPALNLMANLMTMFMNPENTPPPFRVVWNYPDKSCRLRGVDFNLARYGIESNSGEFIEDTIALYYSAHLGKWPYFEFGNDTDTPIHGGFPHYTNFPEHLRQVGDVIAAHQSPSATGYGVIDMELWRPLFKTNYGRYTPYKDKLVAKIASTKPQLDENQHRKIAESIWNLSTSYLMIMSITMAKLTRPHTSWGYYGYPELTTAADNHRLAWLWKTVSAFYPSIYIKDFSVPYPVAEERVMSAVAEAFRVRALYGNPAHPVMAYTDVQSLPEEEREKWLKLAVQVPLEMGVDGIILWSSSKHLVSDGTDDKCLAIQEYVRTVVGPFILNLRGYLAKCSSQLCANRGRCVRKAYAQSVPFLLNRGVPRRAHGPEVVVPLTFAKVATEFKKGYMCQCYTGWHGRRCVQKYPQD